MKAGVAVVAGLALALVAGCLERPVQTGSFGTCPPLEWTEVRLSVEGRALRHALFVSGSAFRPALDCDAPPSRTDLNATAGVVAGHVGRHAHQELRLFFDDGTLRLGVDLPFATSYGLAVRPGSPPTVTDHGQPVAVARHEWLSGPEAGRDEFHHRSNHPLETRDETMALTVASSWNERLLVQAGLTHDGEAALPLGDGGGRVRMTVTAPNGTVVRQAEVQEPAHYASIDLGPGVAPGVWLVHFGFQASNRSEPKALTTFSSWLTY